MKVERDRSTHQQRFENFLAIFGAILALGQIFSQELIIELLPYFISMPQLGYSTLIITINQSRIYHNHFITCWKYH